MHIIFADIDGVLNNQSTRERWEGCYGIDPILLARFNKILENTDVKVVLSSCWRKLSKDVEYLKFIIGIDIIDITPNSNDGIRGGEIQSWLNKHPEVTKYAILDDDSDMLVGQPLFQTSWKTGLTEEIAEDIIKYFNEDLQLCVNCKKLMKRFVNPETGKEEKYSFVCDCTKDRILNVLGGGDATVDV